MRKVTLAILIPCLLLLAACSNSASDGAAVQPGVRPPGEVASAVGPGLTVGEALDSTLDQFLLVNGFLVGNEEDIYLCALLAESYPPQCGGDRLQVAGLNLEDMTGLDRQGGITWSPGLVQLLGRVVDGVITVSKTVSG
jgi:hypothetical protein